MRSYFVLLVVLHLVATPAWAETFYVTPDGDGDGSEEDPTDFQSALDAARTNGEDDNIRLMEGTYDASGGAFTYGSESNDGKAVYVQGGWSADWNRGSDNPDATKLDGGDSSRVMDIRSDGDGVEFTFELDNLTIQNGYIEDFQSPDDIGAGIRTWRDNGGILRVNFWDCVLRDNDAAGTGRGGALGTNCFVWVSGCDLLSNHARVGGAVYSIAAPGGGSSLTPVFRGCRFEGNDNVGGVSTQGSTIYSNVSPFIDGCTFRGEPGGGSSGPGSPVYLVGGGSAEIVNCVFEDLTTDFWGSALHFWNSGGEVTNCLFLDNKAGGDGTTDGFGAVAVYFDAQATQVPLSITNSTFAGNRSRYALTSYGGAIDTRNHATKVLNCVFWDNGLRPIYRHAIGKLPSVGHSLVEGGLAGTGFTDAGGNILDPSVSPFAGPDDYSPATDSVCVDAGSNVADEVPTYDLDGNGRPYDGDGDGTATVDMGAYELAPDLVIEPAHVKDFGIVQVGRISAQTITLRNEGRLDLLVEQVEVVGDNAADFPLKVAFVPDQTIAPGGSLPVEVVFAPTETGSRKAVFNGTSDDPDGASFDIRLIGEGTPITHTPPKGTIGTEITLGGEGFGTKPGKVSVEYLDGKGRLKQKALKVLAWADHEIRVLFRAKLAPGTYPLMITTSAKGEEPREHGKFEVVPPEFVDIEATDGAAGDELALGGTFFGDKKAKPKLAFEYRDAKGKTKRKNVKLVKADTEWDPITGQSRIRFRVPKVEPVTGTLIVKNKVGEVTVPGTFEVR